MDKLSTRHFLSKRESKEVLRELNRLFACGINEAALVERAQAPDYQLLFVEGDPLAIRYDNQYFLTLKGLIRYKPKRKFAMVDKGAIKFVSKGADVMAPGIVNADEQIIEHELVWICDEEHFAPLAIGRALMDGRAMVEAKKGKAIKSIFHVGDNLWKMQG
jgi:PUA domain protein